ncbi:Uncharacterised protein [Sphingobacterium daejeonense]|nr:Uncharacterised protein [Sphingobacterium daejeonense]
MNCIKKVFSLVVLCFSIIMTYAQQAPFGVKGTVVDVESYQPLAGVTVTIANLSWVRLQMTKVNSIFLCQATNQQNTLFAHR